MLHGSESLQFAFCGLCFPSNIERFIFIDRGCSVSFPLLCIILVHDYPEVLFIQLLMGRYLSHLHMAPWAFAYASLLGHGRLSLGHVCSCGMVRLKACPTFWEGLNQFTLSTSPTWVFLLHHFFPNTWSFHTLNILYQTLFGGEKISTYWLLLLHLSANPKAVILMHIRIVKKAG